MRKAIFPIFVVSLWMLACGAQTLQAEPKASEIQKIAIGSFASNISGERRVFDVAIDADAEFDRSPSAIHERRPAIREAIIQFISQKTLAELSSEEGRELLEAELAESINTVLGYPAIKRIYFTDVTNK